MWYFFRLFFWIAHSKSIQKKTRKQLRRIFISKQEKINNFICLHYNQMKKENEASAGILQCKWVFDRQVRDVMEFNWEDEKKKMNRSTWLAKAMRKLFFFITSTSTYLSESLAPIENLYLHNFVSNMDIMIKHRLIIIYVKHYYINDRPFNATILRYCYGK